MSQTIESELAEFRSNFRAIQSEIARVVIGVEDVIELALVGLFAGGHVLLEGVPGTVKTLLARTIADVLNLRFKRVQFTVDLMPADITGTRILTESETGRRLEFVPGPIFTHILLADEINRATPKTQSALLEAMAEHQVTVAGSTIPLEPPFFVLATLNPIEMEGTYPLPEAQLDRFLFKLRLPYPGQHELQKIIGSTTGNSIAHARAVFSSNDAGPTVERMKRLVREVIVAPHVEEHAARILCATMPLVAAKLRDSQSSGRNGDPIARYVSFGASPRGGQALLLGARVYALLDGRAHASTDDVDHFVLPALNHRFVLNFAAAADSVDPRDLAQRALDRVRAGNR